MTEKNEERCRLMAEDLDQVRANLDWQAMFMGLGFQKAAKSKPDDWWALSPFHDEKTTSFHINSSGRWYDFSIGEGGGCIELIQKLEGVNCFEAGQYIIEQGWSHVPVKPKRNSGEHRSAKPKQTARKTKSSVKRTIDKSAETEVSENAPIRQDLLPMCDYHEAIEARGLSCDTADLLGIGYLAQGRSPLRGRIIFQVRDARTVKGDDLSLQPVILSHMGRSVDEEQEPKYLLYEGFQKSREILGQDRLWLDPLAIEKIKSSGCIVLTEGPFDWAKAVEAGLHNVGAAFGSAVSQAQAEKLKALADHHEVSTIRLVFDRDEAGMSGATKAAELLEAEGLTVEIFDWERSLGKNPEYPKQDVKIPENIQDLADLEMRQIQWLRGKGWL